MQNLDSKIDDAVELLTNLENTYKKKDTATKQHIVSSIFPSKLIFDNKKVRTIKINRVVSLKWSNDKPLKESKKKHTGFGVLFCGVESTDIFSNSFAKNLDVLNKLNMFLTEF